jgi:hypothetical protein
VIVLNEYTTNVHSEERDEERISAMAPYLNPDLYTSNLQSALIFSKSPLGL